MTREEHLDAEIETLRATISAIGGYLLNAKIDLETGTKKSARSTIEGAIRTTHSAEAAVTRLKHVLAKEAP